MRASRPAARVGVQVCSPPIGERGFTLVEILVALAVLSLLTLVLYQGLQFGLRVWGRTTSNNAALEGIVRSQGFLRTQMESLYPFRPNADPARRRYPVVGADDEIEFSAPAPQAMPDIGYYRWRVFVRRVGKTDSLWAAWRIDQDGLPATIAGTSNASWTEEELVANIARIRFRYFEVFDPPIANVSDAAVPARPATAPRGEWLPAWRDRARAPGLIELSVEFPDQDRRIWPPLVVRPRVTDDVSCEYDPVSQRCR